MRHWLGKRSGLVGIDIGTRFVRMALIRHKDKNLILERFGETMLPVGLVDNGWIKNPELLAEMIRELQRSLGIRENCAVSTVAVQHTLVKILQMPNMAARELCTAARYQVAAMMPTPLQETVIEVASWGSPDENSQVEVSVVAARRMNVEILKNVVGGAGLKLMAVEIPAISLFRVFSPQARSLGILELSDPTVCISIFRDNCLRMSRVLLTSAHHDMVMETGLQMPKVRGLSVVDPESQHGGSILFADDLLLEIRRSLEYYEKQFGRLDMDRLLISGVSRIQCQLVNYLDSKLPFPVEHAAMPQVIMPDLPPEELDQLFKNYAKAIGLAARRCG